MTPLSSIVSSGSACTQLAYDSGHEPRPPSSLRPDDLEELLGPPQWHDPVAVAATVVALRACLRDGGGGIETNVADAVHEELSALERAVRGAAAAGCRVRLDMS